MYRNSIKKVTLLPEMIVFILQILVIDGCYTDSAQHLKWL